MHLATRKVHDRKEEHGLEASVGKQCQFIFAPGKGQTAKVT